MFNRILASAILVRVVPFAVFAALTIFQGRFGETSQYWIYTLKTVIGAWLLWQVRHKVKEMKWNLSWEAVVVGVAVFAVWVGLDGHYPMMAERCGNFNPVRTYGEGSALAIFFIGVRVLGSSIIVPPLEEIFYRSFLYRFLIKSNFLEIPLSRFHWKVFLVAGVIFGLGHYEWLPGILCAFAYQGLVVRKGRMGDAITAHGITNFLLAVWIVARHAYYFW